MLWWPVGISTQNFSDTNCRISVTDLRGKGSLIVLKCQDWNKVGRVNFIHVSTPIRTS